MGYCYTSPKGRSRGRLCCDACPSSTGVRKRTCPHKVITPAGHSLPYCPAPALCAACWTTRKTYHSGCKAKADAATARYALEAARDQEGDLAVRTCWGDWLKGVPAGHVLILFADLGHTRREYRLALSEHYDSTKYLSEHPNLLPTTLAPE